MSASPTDRTIVTSLAVPRDAEDLARFFERCGSSCFCRYWHFAGDKNEWLERCALAPDVNRRELLDGLAGRASDALGVVAREAGASGSPEEIVGWLKLAPADATPKIFEQRYYRGLPCLAERDPAVLVIGCVLVLPSMRRRGVARALSEGAVTLARSIGAKALIALPRVSRERVSDEELWLGPASVLSALGFRVVHDERPYPVLRLDLTPSGAAS